MESANDKSISSLDFHSRKYDGAVDEVEDTGFAAGTSSIRGFTEADRKDMNRMGKRQEFVRNFQPLSAFSFAVILQGSWVFLLVGNTQGLVDGGLAGLFWSYVWSFFGFAFVMASIAEMAALAPISGGQYHWVSEFAPQRYQRILSYLTGWMSVLAWEAGKASGSLLVATIIQALVVINHPDYVPQAWHATLMIFALALILYGCNVWGANVLPFLQNFLLLIYIIGFLAIFIVLWVKAPHLSAETVFTQFTNDGGWSSMGLSLLVGQITGIWGSLSSDATAHMAEEVTDAGRYVPIAIFWSYIANGLLSIIIVVAYLFAIPDLEAAIGDPSTFPILYVFQNAVSTAGVNALTIIILILLMASNITFNAATSRQLWSFGRDHGLPFGKWISKVDAKREIPTNAVFLTCAITCCLCFINLGSNAAFNAIISLQCVALMFSYTISIGCRIYHRLYHQEITTNARWSLGRYGLPINIVGLTYAIFAFFWSFWPNATPVTLLSFNWSVAIFVGTLVASLILYVVQGRKLFVGPVVDVKRNN